MELLNILSVLYGVIFLLYFSYSVRSVLQKNCIEVVDVVRFMYSFVYGFFPMLLFYKESNGESNLYYYDYTDSGILNLYLLLLFSIIGFILINFGYKNFRKYNKVEISNATQDYKRVFLCGVLSLIIGWVGLFLWTSAYGSLNDFIINAVAIRSGRGSVYNPYAFMQHIAQIVEMALLAFLTVLIGCKNMNWGHRFLTYLLFILSFIGFYYYVMATDSRVQIAYVGVATLLIYLRYSNNLKRTLLLGFIFSLLLLVLTMYADVITRFFRFGEWIEPEYGVIDGIIREFRFTQSAQMASFKLWYNGTLQLKFFDDLINALTSWFPKRFIPFELPLGVWDYNTLNVSGVLGRGQSPSDFLATSIYDLGLLGILIQPIMFGCLIAIVDNALSKYTISVQMNVYYGAFVAMFMHKISHYSLASFMHMAFIIFLYFLINIFVTHIKKIKLNF